MTILLWGMPQDGPLAAVLAQLRLHGVDTALIDQYRMPETRLEVELRPDGTATGLLNLSAQRLDLDQVSALYLRPYPVGGLPRIQAAGPESQAWARAVAFERDLCLWAELCRAAVVNKPSAMASNDSKPYQLQLIAAAGLRVPDTLVTTDADAVREFRARHPQVIYKSVSGRRSKVSRLTGDHEPRMRDLRWCPTQFQQYVPGTDYRVHVIGDRLYTTEVRSTADDYRFTDGHTVAFRAVDAEELTGGLPARLVTLTRALGLTIAGIDLRRTPDGDWYCLEVNPSPAFTYYEQATGQPLAAAVASLLTDAESGEAAGAP